MPVAARARNKLSREIYFCCCRWICRGRRFIWPVVAGAITGGGVPPACCNCVAWLRAARRAATASTTACRRSGLVGWRRVHHHRIGNRIVSARDPSVRPSPPGPARPSAAPPSRWDLRRLQAEQRQRAALVNRPSPGHCRPRPHSRAPQKAARVHSGAPTSPISWPDQKLLNRMPSGMFMIPCNSIGAPSLTAAAPPVFGGRKGESDPESATTGAVAAERAQRRGKTPG